MNLRWALGMNYSKPRLSFGQQPHGQSQAIAQSATLQELIMGFSK
jgi:hypothetical protein